MPTPAEILESLTLIANGNTLVALVWHLIIAGALLKLLRGWRPTPRQALRGLSALPLSVSALAFVAGNPFNGVAFAALTGWAWRCSLIAQDQRADDRRSAPALAVGIAMLVYGMTYPHFLVGQPRVMYLFAAPTGLIPCPTLAVLLGFTLLTPSFFPRSWSRVLTGYGLFYGAYGLLQLDVWLDAVLLVQSGAASLYWRASTSPPTTRTSIGKGLIDA